MINRQEKIRLINPYYIASYDLQCRILDMRLNWIERRKFLRPTKSISTKSEHRARLNHLFTMRGHSFVRYKKKKEESFLSGIKDGGREGIWGTSGTWERMPRSDAVRYTSNANPGSRCGRHIIFPVCAGAFYNNAHTRKV